MTLPDRIPPLPAGASMALWRLPAPAGEGEWRPVHSGSGKWLHPLFELTDLLGAGEAAAKGGRPGARPDGPFGPPGELLVRDRVIGRAAAFLVLRCGVISAWGDVVSDGAVALFEAAGANIGWESRIPAIGCVTEQLLAGVDDPEAAWELLAERRRLTLAGR
jgi:hypothetical protein